MRSPHLEMHKLPLFAWAVFITAFLLLLSLPVLAGWKDGPLYKKEKLAISWNTLCHSKGQSEGNRGIKVHGNPRDYTPTAIKKDDLWETGFNDYLAGLIEGDGTIICPKENRFPSGKLRYPSIEIVFHSKDLPLAAKIEETLGYGSIQKRKESKAYNFVLNDFSA